MSDEKKIPRGRSEQEFDEFLRDDDSRLAALYRKLPQPEPDAQLDARVRALAQRPLREQFAAAMKPAQPAARRPVRWLPALSAAASLIFVAGIAWRVAPRIWPAENPSAAAQKAASGAISPEQYTTASAPGEPAAAPRTTAGSSTGSNAPTSAADAFPAESSAAPAQPTRTVAGSSRAGAPVRRETPSTDAERQARSGTAPKPAQAFPAATADSSELARDKLGKVENAASAPIAAAPASPVPAAKAARFDESEAKQEISARPAAQRDAVGDRAAKSLLGAPQAAAYSAPQSNCPAASHGADWRGIYPPDIPPDPELRFSYVGDLLRQGHRGLALKAYADFHRHCPADRWRRDLLDQLGVQ